MLPGWQVKLTFSTAQIWPRFLSWKRLDKLRASIIVKASHKRFPNPVYYAGTTRKLLRTGEPQKESRLASHDPVLILIGVLWDGWRQIACRRTAASNSQVPLV